MASQSCSVVFTQVIGKCVSIQNPAQGYHSNLSNKLSKLESNHDTHQWAKA